MSDELEVWTGELDDWPDEPPFNELSRLVAERDERIIELESENARLKLNIAESYGWATWEVFERRYPETVQKILGADEASDAQTLAETKPDWGPIISAAYKRGGTLAEAHEKDEKDNAE